jgi:hypothetical protein
MAWYSADSDQAVERVLAAWSDAPVENLEILGMILDTAKEQVQWFAPSDTDDDPEAEPSYWHDDVTEQPRYLYAQLQQAKNLWNAGRASGDGDVGAEGYTFTPRPLDKTIQRIIRPASGVVDVF